MNKIFLEKGRIKRKINFSQEIIGFWVTAENISKHIQIGQFIHIKMVDNANLILRRPFSVADIKNRDLFFIFRIVGKGTLLMSKLTKNDELSILGPLGKPIEIPHEKNILILGGGLGVAPLYFLTKSLKKNKKNLFIILGAKNSKELILKEAFKKLKPKKLIFYTEDGTYGKKGKITDGISLIVEKEKIDVVYTAGPIAMLKEVKLLLENKAIKVYGFLEERMGCGVGLCYVCAVPKKEGGYFHLCEEGPCLSLKEIKL
jgi:dihydroorotate dehydrogenase electron transfer subunit